MNRTRKQNRGEPTSYFVIKYYTVECPLKLSVRLRVVPRMVLIWAEYNLHILSASQPAIHGRPH